MTTFDVWMNVNIPIVVVIDAASADEAKKKALDMYDNGELTDRVWQSFQENNEAVHVFDVVELWRCGNDNLSA